MFFVVLKGCVNTECEIVALDCWQCNHDLFNCKNTKTDRGFDNPDNPLKYYPFTYDYIPGELELWLCFDIYMVHVFLILRMFIQTCANSFPLILSTYMHTYVHLP